MKEATFDQATHLLKLVEDKKVSCSQLQTLYDSGLLSDLLEAKVERVNREELRKALGLQLLRPTYEVTTNRDLTREQSIEAGKYDGVDSDITQEHFSVKSSGKENVSIVLFHFNRRVSSDEAIAEMDKARYRLADIDGLLALGASQPELQKQFPIVALGSVWQHPNGNRFVPCLDWFAEERYLYLYWFESGWPASCRFAAVRK